MTFWSSRKNGSIIKIRLISKSMTSQLVKQTIAIDIQPNILRSKSRQAMKFNRIYDMRNIFVEKSYTKYAGETIPRPLYKKSKLTISLDQ